MTIRRSNKLLQYTARQKKPTIQKTQGDRKQYFRKHLKLPQNTFFCFNFSFIVVFCGLLCCFSFFLLWSPPEIYDLVNKTIQEAKFKCTDALCRQCTLTSSQPWADIELLGWLHLSTLCDQKVSKGHSSLWQEFEISRWSFQTICTQRNQSFVIS